MANWVIGYFGTGKPWVSIPQPGAQSSFDQSMTSDKVTLHLASGFESHQAAVNVLSKALDYRYYIARLEDDLRVSSAGIVNRLEVDESGWSISGEGFESYLSRRVIIDPRDWAAEALERQPVYNYSGTWRQIVWQAVVDIISRTSNRIKPPVRLLGSLTEGRERKTETVEAIDLVSMGEFIDKIRGKEDGVEIRLGAQWHGSLQTGNLEWTIGVGTEQRPFLIPTYRSDGQPRVWPINLAASRGAIKLDSWTVSGADVATNSWVLGGNSAHQGAPFIRSWNRSESFGNIGGAGGSQLQWPMLDVMDTRHRDSDRVQADHYAHVALLNSTFPVITAGLDVRDGGDVDWGKMQVGDLVAVQSPGHPSLVPEGVYPMRITRKARKESDASYRYSLVGQRHEEIEKGFHR